MVIRFHDKWVWDFWFAQDRPDIHFFYLQAPQAIKEESLRHWNVSSGMQFRKIYLIGIFCQMHWHHRTKRGLG